MDWFTARRADLAPLSNRLSARLDLPLGMNKNAGFQRWLIHGTRPNFRRITMLDEIDRLKQDFTDKYVVVDDSVAELQRFAGHVGQVKTINMNGRALVQFDAWNNIGWYDIEVDFLKVVPKPEVAAKESKHEGKPAPAAKATPKPAAAGEKKLSPLEMARMQGAAKPAGGASTEKAAPAAGAKKSTAEILAAARGKAVAGAAPAAKAAPAAPKPAPAATGGKMSTADILAAARAKSAPAAEKAAAPAAEKAAAPPASAAEAEAAPEPVAAAAEPKPAGPRLTAGQRPSVSEILAWCRAHDAK